MSFNPSLFYVGIQFHMHSKSTGMKFEVKISVANLGIVFIN